MADTSKMQPQTQQQPPSLEDAFGGKGLKITGGGTIERKARRFRVIVNEGGEKEPDHVFVGVNGVGFKIQRGTEVVVPESVVHVLQNAVQTLWVKRKDENGREYMEPRRVQRFPFSNLGEDRGEALVN